MNRFHLLIIAFVLFVIGLVIFGGPDISEIRKRRQMRKTKSLVEKIVTSAKKKSHGGDLLGPKRKPPTGRAAGLDTSLDIMVETPMDNKSKFKTKYGDLPKSFKNPYLKKRTPRGMPPKEPEAAPQDNYYPPTPSGRSKPRSENDTQINRSGGIDSAVLKAMQGTMDGPYGVRMQMRDLPEETLQQFHPKQRQSIKAEYEKSRGSYFVAFEGTKAYIKDEFGNVKVMPDGYYEMPGSKRVILIRAGKKVVVN